MNVYAPVESQSRKVLWETMICELPNTYKWILFKDFNMVEKQCDKSSAKGRAVPTPKRRLFNDLKDSLQVYEEPLTSPSLSFSWDNTRIDKDQVMAKLDCYYIFLESLHMQLSEGYRIQNPRRPFPL